MCYINNMKTLGYIRVSTDKQVQNGDSLDNQRESLVKYCKFKNLPLAGIIEDAGISGAKNAGREGFKLITAACAEDPDVTSIVIYSLERISRDVLTLFGFERFLRECEVTLHTIEGEIDLSTPSGFLGFAMRAVMGEMERRQASSRTKAVVDFKKARGEVAGEIPYGFVRKGDLAVEEPAEQEVIALANELYAKGSNLTAICKALSMMGIVSRRGRPFVPTQVCRMLEDYKTLLTHKKVDRKDAMRQYLEMIR